jgi:hypothetical protein
VGTTHDGRQFLAVTCLTEGHLPRQHAEFRTLYLSNAKGTLLYARVKEVSTRSEVNKSLAALEDMMKQLGQITIERISVKPFDAERKTLSFALHVVTPPF